MIRVLHVHDDPEQLRYVKRFLEAAGRDIIVESVISPAEAPTRLLNGVFDAVLSDDRHRELKEIMLEGALGRVKDIPLVLYKGRKEDVAEGISRRGGDTASDAIGPEHILALSDKLVEAVVENRENRRSRISFKVSKALNLGSDVQSSLGETLRIIKEELGINASGIRLQEGDDYPYYVFDGFHDEHILQENELCVTDLEGQLMRDDIGNPVLDCMCGNILRERFDASKPYFTPGGSFWTNSTSELLATATIEDKIIRTRDTCQAEGYESMALIPIRDGSDILGLLQLNDYRPGYFTHETIRFLEGLAEYIGEKLGAMTGRREALEDLEHYREILRSAPSPTLVVDPDDLSILDASDSAAKILGLPRERLRETSCHEALAGFDSICDDHDEECPIVQMLEKRDVSSTRLKSMGRVKGDQRFIESASPIKSPDGSIEFALLTLEVKN